MPLEADPGTDPAEAEGTAPTGGRPHDSAAAPAVGPWGDVRPSGAPAAAAARASASPAGPGVGPPSPRNGPAMPEAGLPDAGEGDQALDPASIVAARIAGAIGVTAGAVSALAAVLVAAVATPLGGLGAAVIGAAALMLSAAGAAACYLWPAARYRHTRYRLDAHGVTIRRGVVWRTVTSVPTSRVQHTDVVRGPLERYFDLATLVVHTAGTRDASVSLGGLGHRAALALRDRLIEAGGGRGV